MVELRRVELRSGVVRNQVFYTFSEVLISDTDRLLRMPNHIQSFNVFASAKGNTVAKPCQMMPLMQRGQNSSLRDNGICVIFLIRQP